MVGGPRRHFGVRYAGEVTGYLLRNTMHTATNAMAATRNRTTAPVGESCREEMTMSETQTPEPIPTEDPQPVAPEPEQPDPKPDPSEPGEREREDDDNGEDDAAE